MDWPLFFSALISATLFPGGSEALLLLRIQQGADPMLAVLIAGCGNVLGSLITYGMGRLGNEALHRKWLRMKPEQVEQAEGWFSHYGRPSLLLAWLPVVGDPLCLVAGLLRSPVIVFVLLVAIGKFARYGVVAWLGI